jgi:Na+/melibiose symporter-like transporter
MQIYFILGLAMVIVVLWDYKNLPETAKRLTRQSQDKEGSFSIIATEIRNWVVMISFAFFLWPLVVLIELIGKCDK